MRWIIGDIHGMLRCLVPLLDRIVRLDPDATLHFVGDYINRGPDSKGVIDLLLALKNAQFIRGNHDDIFDLVLHEECYGPHPEVTNSVAAFKWFMQHGLAETFQSYGVSREELDRALRRPSAGRLRQLAERIPTEHRAFIRNLPPVIEYDDLFVLHAWWSPTMTTKAPSIAQRLEETPALRRPVLWERYLGTDIGHPKPWWRTGYFGHTPVINYRQLTDSAHNVPVTGPNIVLLDTGAALGTYGRLTAYCHERHAFLQVDHEGNVVEEASFG
jgi:serine/threonine protein phosphatase 1